MQQLNLCKENYLGADKIKAKCRAKKSLSENLNIFIIYDAQIRSNQNVSQICIQAGNNLEKYLTIQNILNVEKHRGSCIFIVFSFL